MKVYGLTNGRSYVEILGAVELALTFMLAGAVIVKYWTDWIEVNDDRSMEKSQKQEWMPKLCTAELMRLSVLGRKIDEVGARNSKSKNKIFIA